ncbi:hypothetical protein PFAS1_23290 [Pseudomonas frederiksbergensis]|uniref:hypothetical protein n=1 Tax=Pseudomonas frederiksbergensis TaxID=104087 RepID=UPI000958135E|nr:hypothetical protein [Pseudomonas frederiksbergensis]APV42106.1 hypothetical protein PFAS1_23290 [Pseudomonas frederiksbergensis]
MSISMESQQLHDTLISAAFLLKWSSADILSKAHGQSEAGKQAEADALLKIVGNYQESESRLLGFADEVRGGRIVRAEAG